MKECPNCGSDKLTLEAVPVHLGTAQNNRISMNEVHVHFVLGCDECSETVKTLREDQVKLTLISEEPVMTEKEPKKILTEEEMRIKVEEAIRWYRTGKMDVATLYGLMQSLNSIHNDACKPGDELAWITQFNASYPDH